MVTLLGKRRVSNGRPKGTRQALLGFPKLLLRIDRLGLPEPCVVGRPSQQPQPCGILTSREIACVNDLPDAEVEVTVARLFDFFLNKDDKDVVVNAPAFSITKVMAVVAPVVTALASLASKWIGGYKFTSTEITVLIVSLLAFLAVTASADVLARGMATSAEKKAAGRARIVTFRPPLKAQLALPGPDEAVTVIAISDASPPEYLCLLRDTSVEWHPSADLVF
jgi:hypothetical protein